MSSRTSPEFKNASGFVFGENEIRRIINWGRKRKGEKERDTYAPGVYLIVGGQFGSEGKGNLASVLVRNANFDAFTTNASVNSGHTAYWGEDKAVTRQIPVGSVMQKLKTGKTPEVFINAGAMVDVGILKEESDKWGIVPTVHPCAALILPKHKEMEASPTSGAARIASTAKGCGAALADKINRSGNLWGNREEAFGKSGVVDLDNKSVLYEVAQGYSLGLNDPRFAPHTTSRECSTLQAVADARIPLSKVRRVAMAIRTYEIRVGSTDVGSSGGHFGDQEEISWGDINVTPELTTVTLRQRRVFTFSWEQFTEALRVNEPDLLFVGFMDYLKEEERTFFAERIWRHARRVLRKNVTVLCGFGPRPDDVAAFIPSKYLSQKSRLDWVADKSGVSITTARRRMTDGWSNAVYTIKKRCELRKVEFTITADYLRQLFENQGGKCALTGWDMEPRYSGSGTVARTITVDRIDPNNGYVEGNVRLLCFAANNAKYTWTDDQFVELCKAVVDRNEEDAALWVK